LDPPQGNAIATIVNRNPVEPQPVIHNPVILHGMPQQQTHQKLQQNIQAQSLKNRVSVHQQLQQDVQAPQPPPMPASVGGMWQVRGKRGRGTVRGCGVGRGQHGALNRLQHQTVPTPQQEVKIVPTTKVHTQATSCCSISQRFFEALFLTSIIPVETCFGYHKALLSLFQTSSIPPLVDILRSLWNVVSMFLLHCLHPYIPRLVLPSVQQL
jgi:hypothetical protein